MTYVPEDPKEALRVYESLKLQEKSIKQQLEEFKPALLKILPEDKEVALEFGTIVRSPGRVQWKYSEALKVRIDEVEDAKKLEQQDGSAKAIAGEPFVTYRENKEK